MQEYFVYCGRPERVTIEELTALVAPIFEVRRASSLDGFVLDSPNLCIGVFLSKPLSPEGVCAQFADEAEADSRKPRAPADVLAIISRAPHGITLSALRGNLGDPEAAKFIASLLARVNGYVHEGRGRFMRADGSTIAPTETFAAEDSPDPQRVIARAHCLAALAMRAELEDAGAVEARPLLERLRAALDTEEIALELEEHEKALIDAAHGSLSPEARSAASWGAEGLAVLAWGLGVSETLSEGELVHPARTAARLGFLGAPVPVAPAALRPRDVLEAEQNRLFTAHWRLREFLLTRESMDLVAVAEESWFGLDPSGLPLVETGGRRDLAFRGRPLDALDETSLATYVRLVEERYRAIRWLVAGASEAYSEIDTSA